jgi:pyruvate formate lyase activating enzyme
MVFDIQRFAIHDGPGIRTMVFMKGCPLRCWWCQNPEGLSTSKSLAYFEYRCVGTRRCLQACPSRALTLQGNGLNVNRAACDCCALCAEACPSGALSVAGREVGVEELMGEVERDVLLFDNSGGGVTLSGGEPLFQPAFLGAFLVECRLRGIRTALETSGYASPRVFDSIMDYVDLFLFDVKLIDDAEHRKYTGVSNVVIKRNLTELAFRGRGEDVVLRLPVITGVNDTKENIEGLLAFVSGLDGIKKVDLLPYHDVSEKYARLGLRYKMRTHVAPSDDSLKRIREKLEGAGLTVGMRG